MNKLPRNERQRVFFWAAAILFFALAGPLHGQTTAGSISGTVRDASGAVIPGVTIKTINLANQSVRVATTSFSGVYSVPNIEPGSYKIQASKTGFAMFVRPEVELNVNEALTLNIVLKLGKTTTQVTVTGAVPALQTQNGTIGQVIEHRKIVQLPLNGRQFTQLVLLTPGAAPIENGQQGAFTIALGVGGISPSIAGQNSNFNNFTLDGMENNARFDNTYAVSPPPDAIAEFMVQTHNEDARFALGPGANINVATRAGTADLHGDAWEFLRNSGLDARNFFDLNKVLPSGQEFAPTKPPYRQNQFGFTIGGPVILPGIYNGRKGHTYFFGYYAGFRSREGFTTFSNVPTAAEMSGDFTGLLGAATGLTDALGRPVLQGELFDPLTTRQVTAGQGDPVTGLAAVKSGFVRDPLECNGAMNVICTSRLFSASLAYASLYPSPNFSSSLGNLIADQTQAIDNNQYGIRVDHTFGDNDTLFGRFNWYKSTETAPGSLPDIPTLQTNISVSTMLSYTHLFSPTFLMSLSTGYVRTGIPISPKPAGTALVSKLGLPPSLVSTSLYFPDRGTDVGPLVGISPTITGITQYGWGLGNPDYDYQYNFDFNKIKGNHTVDWGLEWLHYRHVTGIQPEVPISFDNAATNDPTTESGGYGLASYLLGLPTTAANFGFNYTNVLSNIFDFYLQDQWKATPKLTMHLGLQYDLPRPPHFIDNRISTWDPQNGIFYVATTNPYTGAPPNAPSSLFYPNNTNLAPRIGFGYEVNSRTVVRGGFSMFYDHGQSLSQEARDSSSQWPFGPIIVQSATALNTVTTGPMSSRFTFSNPLPVFTNLATPVPPNFAVDIRNHDPRSLQWNLGVQRVITHTLTVDASYVGSADTNIFIQPTANIALTPGPGNPVLREPFPIYSPVSFDTNVGRSNYHSLQLKLVKNFSNGLSFLGSYTWSRCFDIGSTRGSQPQDYYNMNGSYGPCDYDVPQMFVLSYVYDLPLGGHHLVRSSNHVINQFISQWQWSGITTVQTGHPFQIAAPFDVANTGAGSQRASLLKPGATLLPSGFNQTPTQWFNTNPADVGAIPFTYGNISRNALRGPGETDFDLSLSKDIPLSETRRLQFRSEFFNIFNTPHFGQPDGTVESAQFGEILSAGPAREIQFALKFFW